MKGFVATIVEVIDGDTIVTRADLFPLLGIEGEVRHHLRLLGGNAPERNTKAGKAAKKWLTDLALNKGCLVELVGADKYGGRWDANVWLAGDTLTLTEQAIAAGVSKPWDGKGTGP